ncbi:MAG: hypothetical protein ABI565_07240 [Vicinamibacteria bacterium]
MVSTTLLPTSFLRKTAFGTIILFLYFLVLVILGVFGVHRYVMVYV